MVSAAVLATLGYVVWLGLTVRQELVTARAEAHTLRSALTAGRTATAERAVARFIGSVDAAEAHTHSPAWRVLSRLPFVGDDARVVATVAEVGASVGRDAVRPIVDEAGGGLADELAPHHGRIDVAALRGLRPVVDRARVSLDRAATRLGAVDTMGLTGLVRGPFEDLRRQLDSARAGADAAATATQLLPTMLGGDGVRHYLMLFDNNAEIRATGGIPGAWAVIRADHGRITMQQQGSAADFAPFTSPVLAQSPAERAIYDIHPATYFQDVNFMPEFPRTAALARAMYQRTFGTGIDGVLSVDTVTLRYLIGATGPITAPGGVQLTRDNAADELLNGVYRRIRAPQQQDAFFRAVAKAVFDKVTNATGSGSPERLASALARAVTEGRMYVHSFHPAEQSVLDPTQIAGNLDLDAAHPQIGVYLDDATGAKMSYYLRTSVTLTARCTAGRQEYDGRIVFTSTAPKDAAGLPAYVTGGGIFGTDPGDQLVQVFIYGPSGGTLGSFRFDGKATPVPTITDRGLPVAVGNVQLSPGQQTTVTWTAADGAGRRPASARLRVSPGVQSGAAVRVIPRGCAG